MSSLALKALIYHTFGNEVTSYVQMDAERLPSPAHRVRDKLIELCSSSSEFQQCIAFALPQ
jgi:hypothetical protein